MAEDLPAEFWVQPDEAFQNESIQFLYAEISARLRNEASEAPGLQTLEMLMIERVVTLYCHIRGREASGKGFANDRAYKETLQLWMQMAGGLRKDAAKGSAQATEHALTQVQKAIERGLSELPESQRKIVRESIAEALADVSG